jgi:RsiW-degrading membrane proteinase PrsW (M82 family)
MSGLWVLFLLIFVSSIPVIAVYIWFRIARYPFSLVRFLFSLLAGGAALFPALFLQNFFHGFFPVVGRWALLSQIFIRVALTEELSRLLMLFIFFWISSRFLPGSAVYRGGAQDAGSAQSLSYSIVKQGTAAGLVAGLGFAILENVIYGAMDTGVLLRRVFTAPLHSACGSRVGAAAVLFRSHPIQALLRFLTSVAIHGIYNFMINMPGFPSIAAVLIALSAFASSILSIRSGWEYGGDFSAPSP